MTRDDIIRMAREAGASFETAESMFRFAALVAAVEREACAKGCETSVAGFGSETEWADGYIQAAKDIAEGIRARGDA